VGSCCPRSFGQSIRDNLWEGDGIMIDVTKLNGKEITVNCELIETVEETPDTVITLTTGKKIIVKESRQTVKNLVKSYKRECSPMNL
jgi:flagellar protein FlbD